MEQPADGSRAAIWEKFVQAVAEEDYDTTRAFFDAGELGQAHLVEEFELASDSVSQVSCLQNLGSEHFTDSECREPASVNEFKALQQRGLDLKRSGHLYLQYSTASPECH
jgi:hypothetical protein